MDLRLLRSFAAICELGSLSAAARYLGVAQPALSRQLRALETELGARLLTRTARGVHMTEPGERLFRHALDILHQVERVPQVVAGREHAISGRVTIGLPTSVSFLLSALLVRQAATSYPGIRLHLVEALSGHLADWVRSGRLDLAVLFDAEEAPNLRLDPLLIEDLCLVGAPDAFEAGAETIRFERLAEYPLVLPAEPHTIRRLLDRMACSHGVRLRVAVEVDSLNVNKALAREGGFFAVLAEGTVRQESEEGALRSLRVVSPAVSRSVSLAASALPGRSPAAEHMRRLIQELTEGLVATRVWKSASAQPI